MLKKILLKKRNKWQTAGASIGTFAGLFLLLFALQVYLDVQVLTHGAKDDNFLVINKNFDRYMGQPKTFSKEELAVVQQQPFFDKTATFESTKYQVMLSSQKMGFQTLLFFQSVPNIFLGTDTSEFAWTQDSKTLPIILSKDYLALYNYGFAPSQGLPPFSAQTVRSVDFKIRINSAKGAASFDARVVGFTSNINSILVPPEFLKYTNEKYGIQEKEELPTQIMASTSNPYSLELEDFLDKKGYEIARGGLIGGELKSTLYLLILLIVAIGIIVIGLALLVFVLNFQVLIAQASQDIQLLIQLGYTNSSIEKVLIRNFVLLFTVIFVLVLASLVAVKYTLSQSIIEMGYPISYFADFWVWIVALALGILFIGANLRSIQRNVKTLN